jgi:hypothetical protein
MAEIGSQFPLPAVSSRIPIEMIGLSLAGATASVGRNQPTKHFQ